jgi:hypothetical protein
MLTGFAALLEVPTRLEFTVELLAELVALRLLLRLRDVDRDDPTSEGGPLEPAV